jgi:hypothetical protein
MDDEPVLVYRGGGGPPRADLLRSLLEGVDFEDFGSEDDA